MAEAWLGVSPPPPARTEPWRPGAGDVVLVRVEGPGRVERPALVLSPAALSARTGVVLVCPIVDDAHENPFEVPLPPVGQVSGLVLADRITSLDFERNSMRWHASAADGVVPAVLERLLPLLVPAEAVERLSPRVRAYTHASRGTLRD